MEGGRGGSGDRGVIGVGVGSSVQAEGEDDVGPEGSDAADELCRECGEGLLFELAILVVEDFEVLYAEDAAGVGELFAAESPELFWRVGVAAVATCLS
jgi:hypothetical protein